MRMNVVLLVSLLLFFTGCDKNDNLTIESVIPQVMPSVVHIQCPEWQGSGFTVGPQLVCTARHVVEGVTDFTLTTFDGHKLHATRAVSLKDHDIGFIWIDDLTCIAESKGQLECDKREHLVQLTPASLGSITDCRLGETVIAIGSAMGKINFNHVSSGIISCLDRGWEEPGGDYGWNVGWTTTTSGHPGNSGCPIFTLSGSVVGVLVGGFDSTLIIAMPVDLFAKDLQNVTLLFTMDRFRKEELKTDTALVQYRCH